MIPLIPLLGSSAKTAVTNYALKKISPESFFPSLFSKNILNPYGLLGNFSVYTVILFILFAIIIYFIIRIILAKNPVSKSIQYKEKESNMQTGDLVFTSYRTNLGYFMRGWADSVWTHVGMIMKHDGKLYVLETNDYTESWKNPDGAQTRGILVIPFETWKDLNKHHNVAYMPLQTPPEFDRRNLILEFHKIQKDKLDEFGIGWSVWSKLLWKMQYSEASENLKQNVTCFELVNKIYQNTGVMQKKFTPGSYYTGDIIERKVDLEKGFKFGNPMNLQF
jgi:hypothetical protein